MNVGFLLTRSAWNRPDKTALICSERRFTYRELNERVNSLANGLLSMGLRKSDKLAVIGYNCHFWTETFWAASKTGIVLVPLNFRLAGRELAYQIDHSDARAIVIGEEFKDVINSIRTGLTKVQYYIYAGKNVPEDMIAYEPLTTGYSKTEPPAEIGEDEIQAVWYTSGTSGFPKGAIITHENQLFGNFMTISIMFEATHEEVYLVVPSLAARVGTGAMLAYAGLEATIVLLKAFVPEEIARLIEAEKVTSILMVPSMADMFLGTPSVDQYDLSSLKLWISGGAPLLTPTKKRIQKRIPQVKTIEFYGSTEAGVMACLFHHREMEKERSCGKPPFGMEVRLVDNEDKDVAVGEIGEFIVRTGFDLGPGITKGYYKNPAATAQAIRSGWFHTGDLGRMDEDGYYYVVDRKDDMIISGGYNIFPKEVENILLEHPKLAEVAVFGIADEKWGQAVTAVAVPREDITPAELIEFCDGKIARYKIPKTIHIVQEIPKNPAGKVLKRVLRTQYEKKI